MRIYDITKLELTHADINAVMGGFEPTANEVIRAVKLCPSLTIPKNVAAGLKFSRKIVEADEWNDRPAEWEDHDPPAFWTSYWNEREGNMQSIAWHIMITVCTHHDLHLSLYKHGENGIDIRHNWNHPAANDLADVMEWIDQAGHMTTGFMPRKEAVFAILAD